MHAAVGPDDAEGAVRRAVGGNGVAQTELLIALADEWGFAVASPRDPERRHHDIRRRKQSLPILILRESASEEDMERIATLYKGEEIGPDRGLVRH